MNNAVLYIVPTPIGNLSDITQRACDVLAQVDLIAAEDTRHSSLLLKHWGITTPCIALHDHNEKQKSVWIIERIQAGQSVALISDAGTPLISDPGYHLIAACHAHQIQIIPLPGPCAAITGLSASGLATDRFIFEGFLPARQSARQKRLHELALEPRTLIFYESPKRVLATLEDMYSIMGARPATLARELTKTFETIIVDLLPKLMQIVASDPQQQRGEIVLILQGASTPAKDDIPAPAKKTFELLREHLPVKTAAGLTAKIHDISKNALYKMAHKMS